MKKILIPTFSFLMALIFLFPLSQITMANESNSNIYENKSYNYSINFPQGWEVKEGIATDVKAVFKDKNSLAMITISISENIGGEDIESITPESVFQFLKTKVNKEINLKLLDSGYQNINKTRAIWLKIQNTNFDTIELNYMIISNKYYYFITGLAQPAEYFEKFQNILKDSMETFEVIKEQEQANTRKTTSNKTSWLEAALLAYGETFIKVVIAGIALGLFGMFFKKKYNKN